MCKCGTKAENFDYLVRKAKAKSTPQKEYGVYQIKNAKTNKVYAFLTTVENIKKVSGICCYYDKDGNNIDLPKAEPKLAEAKAEVSQTVAKKKTRKRSDKKLQKPNDS